LGLAADVLKLVEHPPCGLLATSEVNYMNAIGAVGRAPEITAHGTTVSFVMGDSYPRVSQPP
jgi:hypothetical protein